MKLRYVFFLQAVTGLLGAQTFEIIKGAEYDCPKKIYYLQPAGIDKEAFYVMKNAHAFFGGKDVLHKLDINSANTVYYKDFGYDYEEFKWNLSVVGVFNTGNGKIRMFLKCSNEAQTKMKLFVREFNTQTGEESAKPKLIDELEIKNKVADIARLINYKVAVSEDGSRILAVSEFKQDEKEQQVKLQVLDGKTLEGITVKNAARVFQNSTIFSLNYLIDNAGNIAYTFRYLYTEDYKYGTNHKLGEVYGVGLIPQNSKENFLYSSFMKDKCHPEEPIIKECNGTVICSGRFSNHEQNKAPIGFYFYKLDMAAGKIASETKELVNEDFIARLGYKEGGEAGVWGKTYKFYNAVGANNGFYIIRYHYDNGKYGTDDLTKEIVVYRYSNSGKQEWVKIIPHYGDKTFGNIGMGFGKKIYLFYYDSPENLTKFADVASYDMEKYKKASSFGNSKLVCLSFNENGQLKREVVDTGNEEVALFYNDADLYWIKSQNSLITETKVAKEKARYNLVKVRE